MKKATMTVSFDEEKLNALKMYLGQKGQQLEGELARALDMLYTKNVPAGVREFIDMRFGAGPAPAPKPAYKKKPDPSPPLGRCCREGDRGWELIPMCPCSTRYPVPHVQGDPATGRGTTQTAGAADPLLVISSETW